MSMPLFDEVHTCEGCQRRITGKLPVGWAECGTAKADQKRLACWCMRCQLERGMPVQGQEKSA